MAAADIVMKMGLDTRQFDAGAKRSLAIVGGLAAGVAGVAVGLKAAKDAMVKYTKAANEQAIAEAKLGNLLGKNNIQMSKHRVAAFAAARQAVTNYGDETTMQILGTLAPLRLSAKSMEQLTVATQDMAAVSGKSAEKEVKKLTSAIATGTATSLDFAKGMTKAEQDTFRAGDAAERAGILIKLANERIGGSAEAAADPVVQFNNAMGDLDQAIGALVNEEGNGAFQLFTGAVVGLTDYLNTNGSALRAFFGDLAQDFGNLARAVNPAALGMIAIRKIMAGDITGALGMMPGGAVAKMLMQSGAQSRGDVVGGEAGGGTGTGGGGGAYSLGGGTLRPRRARAGGGTYDLGGGTMTPIAGYGQAINAGYQGPIGAAGAMGLGMSLDATQQGRSSVAIGLDEDRMAMIDLIEAQQASASMWSTWAQAGRSALGTVGGALFDLAAGQAEINQAFFADLAKQLGQQVFNLGVQTMWQGGANLIAGATNPLLLAQGGAQLAYGGAAVAAGLGLGAVGAALTPPSAGAGGGVGAGPRGATGGGGGGGNITINNTYGAIGPSAQDQARELARVFRVANRSGIIISGA